MRYVIALVLSLGLAGCAARIANPVSPPTLDKVEAAFGAAYELGDGYRRLCAARQIPPSCRTVVPKIQFAASKAQNALLSARDLVDNHPTIDATTAILTANRTVNDLQSILTRYGVK